MNLENTARFVESLADLARPIARRYFRTPVPVDVKADATPVSRADREIEAALRARIREAWPDHGILGEEEGGERLDAEWVWVLDPIDGTRAFLAGKPTFGTLIALCHRGVPVLGVLDQPISGERWLGAQGQRTTLNGAPLKTRTCEYLATATFATTDPSLCAAEKAPRFRRVMEGADTRIFGADCYAYGLLAAGFIDVVAESGLKPYDFCALAPIVSGAGGAMTDWQGRPLTLDSGGDVLACGDARVHAEALAVLAA